MREAFLLTWTQKFNLSQLRRQYIGTRKWNDELKLSQFSYKPRTLDKRPTFGTASTYPMEVAILIISKRGSLLKREIKLIIRIISAYLMTITGHLHSSSLRAVIQLSPYPLAISFHSKPRP